MKSTVLFGTLMIALAAPAAAQQTPQVVEQANVPNSGGAADRTIALMRSGGNLSTVSCADFAALDSRFYPEAVTIAANQGRPRGSETETVDGIETVVPAVVTACRASPGNSFVSTVRAAVNAQGN